ncbi:MAG: hypothetical protein V4660_19240 [Pseudomonadota bacterium]
MKIIFSIAVLSVCTFGGTYAVAAHEADHKAHYPYAASSKISNIDSKTVSVNKPMAQRSMEQESMEKMDSHMKAMHEMHEKMMSAKTPEERKAHMTEHMQTMQGGMAMMNDIARMCSAQKMDMLATNPSGEKKSSMKCDTYCEMEARNNMLEKRMEIMEAMMQMLVDRVNSENYDAYADRVLKK